jgi:transcriptional regulator with XRE-family HTH domain
MTNSKMLRAIIDANGYKLSFVASKLGLTRNGLMNKINNITDFTIPEVQKLCKLLHIEDFDEINAIFFALDVD